MLMPFGAGAELPKLRVGKWFFPFVLAATLLQNFHDLSALMTNGSLALYAYTGPIIYKLGKEHRLFVLAGLDRLGGPDVGVNPVGRLCVATCI